MIPFPLFLVVRCQVIRFSVGRRTLQFPRERGEKERGTSSRCRGQRKIGEGVESNYRLFIFLCPTIEVTLNKERMKAERKDQSKGKRKRGENHDISRKEREMEESTFLSLKQKRKREKEEGTPERERREKRQEDYERRKRANKRRHT